MGDPSGKIGDPSALADAPSASSRVKKGCNKLLQSFRSKASAFFERKFC